MAIRYDVLSVPNYLSPFVYIKTLDYGLVTLIKVTSLHGSRSSEMEFDLDRGMTPAQMWVRVHAEHIRLNQEETAVRALLR